MRVNITLEQARTLCCLYDEGSYTKAGAKLRKAHTAVLYSIRAIEKQLGMSLVRREGYRSHFTRAGIQFVQECRYLLDAEAKLLRAASELETGWEPSLKLIYDGIFPTDPILSAFKEIRNLGATTRFHLEVDYLGGVEKKFLGSDSAAMISILPSVAFKDKKDEFEIRELAPLAARLVASPAHPIFKSQKLRDSHVLVTVKGSDDRLMLPLQNLSIEQSFVVGDFHSKKSALVGGFGIGWMPIHMIGPELKSKRLRALPTQHKFRPLLIVRKTHLGRAMKELSKIMTSWGQ